MKIHQYQLPARQRCPRWEVRRRTVRSSRARRRPRRRRVPARRFRGPRKDASARPQYSSGRSLCTGVCSSLSGRPLPATNAGSRASRLGRTHPRSRTVSRGTENNNINFKNLF